MEWKCNDGGREAAGYKGSTGDCAVRAIAIATGMSYRDVYVDLNTRALSERPGKRGRKRSNARTGVHTSLVRKYMQEIGWTWTPTMFVGQGCRVHVKASELPAGRLVLNLSRHFAAMVDGVLHDTYDCSREETRCVYGYWSK